MKRKLLPMAILCGVALGAGVTAAQRENNPTGNRTDRDAKPAPKSGEVILRGQSGMHDDVKGLAKLTGNVVVRQEGEDFVLYADSVTYDRENNQATATGSLRVETRDSTIVGLGLRADFNTKHIVISGNVVMNSHGKDSGMKKDAARKPAPKVPSDSVSEIAHKPSKMTCDKIDFNYDIREALVTGNIHVTQGQTSGTCRQITFDEENNVAELKGDVLFTDKEGQTFATEVLTIWFDADKLEFQGPFTLKGKKKKEEAAPEASSPGKAPPPGAKKRDFGKPPEVPALDKEPPAEKAPEQPAAKPDG